MDSTPSRRKLPTKHRWKRTNGTGDTVIDSMKDVVEIHAACGAYCRMPRCRFVQPVYWALSFYAHFRREHPEEAQRRGLCGDVGPPEPSPLQPSVSDVERLRNVPTGIHRQKCNDVLGLKRKTLKTVVLEYVSRGVDGWHCRIAGNGCPFVKEVLVAQEFRRHFRLEHPREAEKNGFFEARIQGKTKKRRRQKQPAKTPLQTSHSKQLEANSAQTTPSTDPTTYCRLCFADGTSLEPIFNRPGDDNGETNLANLIETCTGVWLNADEDGHSSICAKCYQRLNEIQSFRQQCQRLDRIVVGEREESKTVHEIEQVLVDESEYLVEMLSPESVEKVEEQPSEEDIPRNGDGFARNDHDREKPTDYSSADQNESFALVMVDERPYYKCSDCDTLTRVRSTVSRHWNRYHRDGDWKEKKVHCSVSGCSKFFMEFKALKQHLELSHRIRIFK